MIVNDFIKDLDSKFLNDFTKENKLVWINDIETSVYEDIIEEYRATFYRMVTDVSEYDLDIDMAYIDSLWVEGVKYSKVSLRDKNKLYTYWIENDKLNIYPKPLTTDTEYVSDELEFTDNSIITSGDDFSGFRKDDTVLISGCEDEPGNNKYAKIISTSDDTLTFAPGTFATQVESAEVTIREVSIKMVYKYIPPEKTLLTDTLLLPRRFYPLYYYYCYAQISYLQEDYDKYDNHMKMYNRVITDLENWWEDNRPISTETQLIDRWREG